jgi:acetylornithine deacetylase/succinyl-diaminopimelate desuccinylase-like protein
MTDALLQSIRPDRIMEDLWELVNIPSPTGAERDAALWYAQKLREIGLHVELDETFPQSPTVIGRLRGASARPTLQLAGHLDHIDVPHPAPVRDGKIISARGSADMKGGLVGILEALRMFKQSGEDWPGEILVTAYGGHEAPAGDSSSLYKLIHDGVIGDAAVITENIHSDTPNAVIAGKGMAIWNLKLSWAGESCHELNRPPEADGLRNTLQTLLGTLCRESDGLKSESPEDALLGRPSLFVGQVHYGDFYNRQPVCAELQGTRRWNADQSFDEIRQEFEELLGAAGAYPQVSLDLQWQLVGDSYSIDPQDPIVRALRDAQRQVLGREGELQGIRAICDSARLVPAGVPSVLLEFDTRNAHADREEVHQDRLAEATRVLLITMRNYFRCPTTFDSRGREEYY